MKIEIKFLGTFKVAVGHPDCDMKLSDCGKNILVWTRYKPGYEQMIVGVYPTAHFYGVSTVTDAERKIETGGGALKPGGAIRI